jgi:CheY-like chemotaxis protein
MENPTMHADPILIVEDEIFLAMDIENILQGGGYRVVGIAADRAEAMAAAKDAKIAFVDVNLRDGPTGPAIARDLADQYGITVVYVTANPAPILTRARGALGVVAKPFRVESILNAASLAGHCHTATGVADPGLTLFA